MTDDDFSGLICGTHKAERVYSLISFEKDWTLEKARLALMRLAEMISEMQP